MTDRPEPFIGPDVDLRGYGWMPMYGNHLFGSEFNARVSDEAWRAGVTLWWAAWNQTPAGSLPKDDVALCRLADLGRDVKAWKRIKTDALHGFVECSDGRLYHGFICKLAQEAWDKRVKERDRKARYRATKERSENVQNDVPGTGTGTGTGHGTETFRERLKEDDRTGQDRTRDKKEEESRKPSELVAATEPDGTASASGLFDRFGHLLDEHFPDRQRQAFEVQPKYIGEGIDICAAWLKAGIPPDFIEAEFARIMASLSAKGAKVQGIRYFRDAIPESWERQKAEAGGPVSVPMPTELADARRTLLMAKRDDEFKEIGRIFEADGAGPAMAKARECLARLPGAAKVAA
jgi:hypothetical protein